MLLIRWTNVKCLDFHRSSRFTLILILWYWKRFPHFRRFSTESSKKSTSNCTRPSDLGPLQIYSWPTRDIQSVENGAPDFHRGTVQTFYPRRNSIFTLIYRCHTKYTRNFQFSSMTFSFKLMYIFQCFENIDVSIDL